MCIFIFSQTLRNIQYFVTMRRLTSCVLFLYMLYQSDADSTYTTKYDGVDLDEILGSERLLSGYVNCLLDNGPCTPDGKELKSNLPDAIDNDCKKCTDRQREGADRVMHYIIDNRPDDWVKLENKYNADGSYKKKYLDKKTPKEDKQNSKESNAED